MLPSLVESLTAFHLTPCSFPSLVFIAPNDCSLRRRFDSDDRSIQLSRVSPILEDPPRYCTTVRLNLLLAVTASYVSRDWQCDVAEVRLGRETKTPLRVSSSVGRDSATRLCGIGVMHAHGYLSLYHLSVDVDSLAVRADLSITEYYFAGIQRSRKMMEH